MCAGLGTRLRPLTTLVPKPLVPVGDKPLVEHAIAVLYAAGARDVALNAFYLPEQVSRFVDVLRNEGARRFYGREGFVEVGGTPGDNEEGLPDVLLAWKPA